jgi:hypothetical protein
VADCCECGSEPSSFIKCGDFFSVYLKNWLLLKRTLLYVIGWLVS